MTKSEAEKVEDIGNVFQNNKSIENFSALQYFGITSLAIAAFSQCSKLETIALPESIKSIGGQAFYNTKISDVYVPASVTSYSYPHRQCNILTIKVAEGNKTFNSANNCNAVLRGTSIIEGSVSTIIPDNITSIDLCAFSGRKFNDTTLDLSNYKSLIVFGAYAFEGTNLVKIILPENFKSLGSASLGTSTLKTIVSYSNYIVTASNFPSNLVDVYVRDELVEDYKQASAWSNIADKIKPLSEYTE